MTLEDELNRLFQDERIDVPVRPGAELVVVAGARRRRHRRKAAAVAGGAFTMVALAAAGIALAGVGGGRTDTLPATNLPVTTIPTTAGTESGAPVVPPTASSSVTPPSSPTGTTTSSAPGSTSPSRSASRSSVSPTASQQRPASTDTTIGPSGWGRLALGMREAEAVATDEFDMAEGVSGSPCHRYWLRNTNGAPVDISPTYGVVRIAAKPGVTTPEGIGVGSTDAEVMAVYPNATSENYIITAPVPGNSEAVYRLNTDPQQRITGFSLILSTHDCY